MKKEYTIADNAKFYRSRAERMASRREQKIIRKMVDKIKNLDSSYYHFMNKQKKRQLRAEAWVIPLEAFR